MDRRVFEILTLLDLDSDYLENQGSIFKKNHTQKPKFASHKKFIFRIKKYKPMNFYVTL